MDWSVLQCFYVTAILVSDMYLHDHAIKERLNLAHKNRKCLPGGEAPEGEKLQEERRNNIELYQAESSSSATCSRSCKPLSVRELQIVEYGEEVLVDYGSNYPFK